VVTERLQLNSLVEGCDLAAVTLAFEGGGPERDTMLLRNALAEKGVLRRNFITRESCARSSTQLFELSPYQYGGCVMQSRV